jgi:hypothetical protein
LTSGWSSLPRLEALPLTCPDAAAVLALAGLAAVWTVARALLAGRSARPEDAPPPEVARLTAFSAAVVAGYLAILVVAPFNPRYLVVFLPHLAFLFVVFTRRATRSTLAIRILLAAAVGLNLWNSHGDLYPSARKLRMRYPDAYYLAERSFEYLDQHRSDEAALRRIAREPPETPILAERPYGFYLALPKLGLVESPRRGWMIGCFSDFMPRFRHADLRRAEDLADGGPLAVLGRCFAADFDPRRDELLYRDDFTPPLLAFVRPPSGPVEPGRNRNSPYGPETVIPIHWTPISRPLPTLPQTLLDRLNAQTNFEPAFESNKIHVFSDDLYRLEIQIQSPARGRLRLALAKELLQGIPRQWWTEFEVQPGENWTRFDVRPAISGEFQFVLERDASRTPIVLVGASLRPMRNTPAPAAAP